MLFLLSIAIFAGGRPLIDIKQTTVYFFICPKPLAASQARAMMAMKLSYDI